jgi:predicted enzyme related to lactoylglutathione lyase
MSSSTAPPDHGHPAHGQVAYLQLPTTDLDRSVAFYEDVFGWEGETEHGSFTAPGLIGQWSAERPPSADAGPVIWIAVADLGQTLRRASEAGGTVVAAPTLDQGERWVAELLDPSGTRIGVFAAAPTARPQTMLAVRDVEAASRWYQRLLGLASDHGGPEYERLLAEGVLVLQLHRWDVEHHHGPVGADSSPAGNGVLVWFGEVSDFDGVVDRAAELQAPVLRTPHRNPPTGEGVGPGHREIWIRDLDGYTVVVASPDGEAYFG